MDKIRWKLYQMMQGRNGMDDLNRVIMIAAAVLFLFSGGGRLPLVADLACVGWIWGIFRCFSRNLSRRQRENQKYLGFVNLNKMRFRQRKEYRIFRCKSCGRNIRVPRKKGKLEITCPVCGTKTIRRT